MLAHVAFMRQSRRPPQPKKCACPVRRAFSVAAVGMVALWWYALIDTALKFRRAAPAAGAPGGPRAAFAPDEQYTVRVNTFRRPALLREAVAHWRGCARARSVQVVWADVERAPPAELEQPERRAGGATRGGADAGARGGAAGGGGEEAAPRGGLSARLLLVLSATPALGLQHCCAHSTEEQLDASRRSHPQQR